MPLRRIQEFVGVSGGPTPRDAVLLKSLLVVHEGIAWAVDRPHYRWCFLSIVRRYLPLTRPISQSLR